MLKRAFGGSVPRGTVIRSRDLVRDLPPEDRVMVIEEPLVGFAAVVEPHARGEGGVDQPTDERPRLLFDEVRDPEEIAMLRRLWGSPQNVDPHASS